MSLAEILCRHGSDKASKHHYEKVYEGQVRGDLLEVGVFKGASLKAWREYLPGSAIVGLDLFVRHSLEDVKQRIYDPSVELIQGDSTEHVRELHGREFDTIIDDGCHWPRVQADTLINLWPLLKEGGSYFIEDVWSEKELDHPWAKRHQEHLNKDAIAHLNNVISLVDYDFLHCHPLWEETGEPDSCIIQLVK